MRPKPPEVLQVDGHRIKVKMRRLAPFPDGYPMAGQYVPKRKTIELSPDHTLANERAVLIHEILHACRHLGGLPYLKQVEEQMFSTIEPYILALLRENPKLVAYLTATP